MKDPSITPRWKIPGGWVFIPFNFEGYKSRAGKPATDHQIFTLLLIRLFNDPLANIVSSYDLFTDPETVFVYPVLGPF